ncbi:putative helicase MOV-10 [Anneissia japonica]|uniref:putative helicase MOV-10 n=1 Tax=Anneissia japonica TaxID=1529436 RepID=UPI0014258779|nr:putative helicase MOV-10 [Anneissia japonica]
MAPNKLSGRNFEKMDITWSCFTSFLQDKGKTLDQMNLEELHTVYDNEFSVKLGDNGPSFIFEKLINDLKWARKIKINRKNNTVIEISPSEHVTIGQYRKERKKNARKASCDRNALCCEYCDVINCSQRSFDSHWRGRNHCGKMRLLFQNNWKTWHKDKYDIEVTSDHDVKTGILVEDANMNELVEINITISNKSENDVTLLLGWLLMNDSTFKVNEPTKHVKIPQGDDFTFPVFCKPESVSDYRNLLALAFAFPGKNFFQILRNIVVEVESELTRELKPKSPYVKSRRTRKPTRCRKFIDGVRLSYKSLDNLEMTELQQYEIPEELETMMDEGDTDDISKRLEEKLTSKNYAEKFSTLLHIEERQMALDILQYSMEDAIMTPDKNRRLLKLNVPGLAENRPSVLKGDHLFATLSVGERYKGYVHRVEMEDLVLGFNSSLVKVYIRNSKFKIDFTFNRRPLMLQHRAVMQAIPNGLKHVLFPKKITAAKATLLNNATITFFNRDIKNNAEQSEAVRHITKGSSRPAPYLVFGPPGTGKTVTIVEAIKQEELIQMRKSCSNSKPMRKSCLTEKALKSK